jgi:hypothetical protein
MLSGGSPTASSQQYQFHNSHSISSTTASENGTLELRYCQCLG